MHKPRNQKQLQPLMEQMGLMMDYAVYDLAFSGDAFFALFLSSGVATEITLQSTNPNPSGIQFARDVIFKSFGRLEETPPTFFLDKSPEYWAAFVLTYVQQVSGLSFSDITNAISFDAVVNLYPALHKTDLDTIAALFQDKYNAYLHTKKE